MLGKNLISSVLTQVPLFIFGVVVGIFSTRILGDEGKGIVALFQANSQFFVLLFSLGIQTGIVYFISSKKIAQKIVVGMTTFIFISSSIILLLLLFISHILGIVHCFLPSGYTSFPYLLCLFILYVLTFFNSIIAGFFQAHSKFILLNWISIANSIINLLVFGILFFVLQSNHHSVEERVNYVLLATLCSVFINGLALVYFQLKTIKIKLSFHFKLKKHFKPFIFYNFSIYFGMFINFFNYRLDLWIINNYLEEKNLSYYSLAANIVQIILYISVAIGSVLLPNLSSKNELERTQTFIRISRISFSFFVFINLVAFLSSNYFIPLMYGKDFFNTVIPFQLLLPGILFSCITQLFSSLIVSNNRNQLNIIACSTGLIVTLVGGFTLIPKLGINGASFVTTISYFVIFLISYIFVLKLTRKATLNLFIPSKKDIQFIRTKFQKNT
jgi:O-antigen/teichoic acid export membrane protein